ncbi:MAG: glycosyl transferase family 1, partial [Anaerolineae bacterium]|nr:glycosyl transferase family 1 [Anaerolineae bacterium]
MTGDETSFLIVSHDVVGERMAGPGIRYWELARELGQFINVTLAVPSETSLAGDGFDIVEYSPADPEGLLDALENSDVVMPCGNTL